MAKPTSTTRPVHRRIVVPANQSSGGRAGGLTFWSALCAFVLGGCAAARPPIRTVANVDLPRFMGDWYVIANIPTFVERGAHNAVESYRQADDGTIATTFRFRDGSFDGAEKTYHPTGFVFDRTSNAVWGMQFVWPIKADYRIVYVDDDYTQTIVGREARDYVWIMARQPSIPAGDYRKLLELLAAEGYDTTQIQKVPQRWPERQ